MRKWEIFPKHSFFTVFQNFSLVAKYFWAFLRSFLRISQKFSQNSFKNFLQVLRHLWESGRFSEAVIYSLSEFLPNFFSNSHRFPHHILDFKMRIWADFYSPYIRKTVRTEYPLRLLIYTLKAIHCQVFYQIGEKSFSIGFVRDPSGKWFLSLTTLLETPDIMNDFQKPGDNLKNSSVTLKRSNVGF